LSEPIRVHWTAVTCVEKEIKYFQNANSSNYTSPVGPCYVNTAVALLCAVFWSSFTFMIRCYLPTELRHCPRSNKTGRCVLVERSVARSGKEIRITRSRIKDSRQRGVCEEPLPFITNISEYFGFPCQSSFHHLLHNHPHLTSGAGTIGQKWPQYNGLSPTPLAIKKEIYK
jgi:hypothetical protein